MKPMLRAICELVQTGSMLFSATCGTMASVCALPAIAGRANAPPPHPASGCVGAFWCFLPDMAGV